MISAEQDRSRRAPLVLLTCALAALLEGLDNQSMGVAAPKLLPEFSLSASQASIIFSATTAGLFVGAAVGGRLADRYGRSSMLKLSLLLFGICSLLTAVSIGPMTLFTARVLTGLGLGGAMPNFIALASEATHSSKRVSSVTLVMAGMPAGGLVAGLLALGGAIGWSWRVIFYVGGIAPILLAFLMRASPRPLSAELNPTDRLVVPVEPVLGALFGSSRALTTSALWCGFFFTQLVLLLMLNWLPSLIVGLGFSHEQASLASICFNFSGACGSVLLGRLHAGAHRRAWVLLTYGAIALAWSILPSVGHDFGLAASTCAVAGIFTIGAQLILFALAPLYYPPLIRGTGVGAAVAVGRLGSVVGPLYGGALLAAGGGSAAVLFGIVPFVIIGGAAAVALTWRPQVS
jgi:MFS transporter, AAHS family, 3-hydroxyphenylpropionic acid transporter